MSRLRDRKRAREYRGPGLVTTVVIVTVHSTDFYKVLRGISFLVSKGMVPKELSCSTIVLDRGGHAKIGIAIIMDLA